MYAMQASAICRAGMHSTSSRGTYFCKMSQLIAVFGAQPVSAYGYITRSWGLCRSCQMQPTKIAAAEWYFIDDKV